MKLLEAALAYANEFGFPVFPCEPRGKRPLTPHGFHDATTDEDQILAWWTQRPDANIGIPTGLPETFEVLDEDGPPGAATLETWQAEHGTLPAGPQAVTGAGRQYLFRTGTLAGRNAAHRRLGIDVRAAGGYVVVAPSVHPNGRTYELEDLDEPIPEAPAWLRGKLEALGRQAQEEPPAALGPEVNLDDATTAALLRMSAPVSWGGRLHAIAEGGRNDALFRWGASLRGRGQDAAGIGFVLGLANAHLCQPPVDEAELRKIVGSAARLEVNEGHQQLDQKSEKRAEREIEKRAEARVTRKLYHVARDAGEHPERVLLALEQEIGLPIRRVVQYGRRPARYHLHFHLGASGGEVVVAVGDLLSRVAVRRAVLDQTGHLIPVGAKRWDAVALLLRRVAEAVDPEEEGIDGETALYVEQFLDSRSKYDGIPEAETEARAHERIAEGAAVFRWRGETWIAFSELSSWCSRQGLSIPKRELATRLREAGFERRRHRGQGLDRLYWVRREPVR